MSALVAPPTLSVQQPADSSFLLFTVTFTARYAPHEIGRQFARSCAFFESDAGEPFGGDDDHITNTPIETYFPSSAEHTERFFVEIHKDLLDTESGGEEIYAIVHWRPANETVSQTARTSELPIAV
ncbi:hypothetical protein OIE67_25635 [Nonomuraea fuscirosea]|uniref:hypothetical protein n=1 Tax=Nonomuraea fuscirosea TaxID=1291556 RepID=UPI002DD9D0C0|nr:hypothetical protein [Nonomuraea fuscirosea]WSA57878.1 hypothetical protein OIE67_25635 [Nonomuraea fuscirosea]